MSSGFAMEPPSIAQRCHTKYTALQQQMIDNKMQC